MACVLVPLAEGIVVSAVKKIAFRSKDSSSETVRLAKEKVGMLEKMLYGGSFLLGVEHIYHGEISFIPPFLTAMKTPEEIPVMLHEMATNGVAMSVLVTAVWAIGVVLSKRAKKTKMGSALCA